MGAAASMHSASGVETVVHRARPGEGLAHETLYRVLAALQAEGLIRRRGRSIVLLKIKPGI